VPVTMAEILQIAMRRASTSIRVALPGRVTRVKSTGRVDVRVELRVARPIPDETYAYDDVPELVDVPVLWQSTQAAAIVMKLQPGDAGLVIFADHQLGAWLTAGQTVNPVVPDAHGYSGAVFSPGLWPTPEAPEIVPDGLRVEVRDGVRLDMAGDLASFTAGGSAAFLALKSDVDSVKGQLDTLQTTYNAHTHGAPSGGGTTTTPSATAAGSSTVNGTTVLKSE
jgi:hypothetical protein